MLRFMRIGVFAIDDSHLEDPIQVLTRTVPPGEEQGYLPVSFYYATSEPNGSSPGAWINFSDTL